jgi:hypothetical protein
MALRRRGGGIFGGVLSRVSVGDGRPRPAHRDVVNPILDEFVPFAGKERPRGRRGRGLHWQEPWTGPADSANRHVLRFIPGSVLYGAKEKPRQMGCAAGLELVSGFVLKSQGRAMSVSPLGLTEC